jgi:hypothetical protein
MVYASDLVDEGFEHVVDVARDRGGVDGLELGAIYHHGRDLYPHNPRHRLLFLDGGACFFRPDPSRFRGQRIQPHLAQMLAEVDPLRRLVEVGDARGMGVRAWTINLHNFTLGERHPECTAHNAFGDRSLTDLCPANPDARAYVRTVSGELARAGVETIVAESVCYMPLEHGFHHERLPYALGDTARFLLSVCFCAHCLHTARTEGVDVEGLRGFVRTELDRALAGAPNGLDEVPLQRTAVVALAGGEMGGLLEARERTVTSLVREIADEVRRVAPGCRYVFMDSMGADETRDQSGDLVAERAWRFGVDLPEVAAACHGISMMGYSRDVARFEADGRAYRTLLAPGTPLSLVLRAMPPDCLAAADLPPKVRLARELEVDWLEFYVYGLMRLTGLDWIRDALAA